MGSAANRIIVSSAVLLALAAGLGRAQGIPTQVAGGVANGTDYLAQKFSYDVLAPDVKQAIDKADLPPVTFNQITLQMRDQVVMADQPKPSTYTSAVMLQNAGHGLIRRAEVILDNGNEVARRYDLTYRGYFAFLTQGISAHANEAPPIQAARKIIRFDTATGGHMAFIYLYGDAADKMFQDPGQFICNSGKTYAASQLSLSIEGQARELQCTAIDTNGTETDKVTMAYLEKYGVAITLHMQNDQRTVDNAIQSFNAR